MPTIDGSTEGLLTLEASGVRYTNVNLPITSLKKYLAPPSQVRFQLLRPMPALTDCAGSGALLGY